MLVHGFLLVHNVGTQVSPTGDGAHGDRPDIFLRLLRCIAPGIIRGSEGRKVIQECLAHGVLRGHCDGFEHRSHHPIWSRQDLERLQFRQVLGIQTSLLTTLLPRLSDSPKHGRYEN